MLQLSACPVCLGINLVHYLSAQDHTVSHETFQLTKCSDCGFVMTNPRPENQALAGYYDSAAYISHSDSASTLIDRVYKISRRFTLNWKYRIVQKYSVVPPASLLDFGCGTGAFLQECQKRDIAVAGVEPAEQPRTRAIKNTGAQVHAALSGLSASFEAITAWHVLEHVPDIDETLRSLKTKLTSEGTMFIAVPNHLSYDARKYRELWAGYDVPRHLWHFSKKSMEKIVNKQGLKLIQTIPMQLDAYYVSLLSEKYKTAGHSVINAAHAMISGWKSNRKAKTTGEYSSLIYILRK